MRSTKVNILILFTTTAVLGLISYHGLHVPNAVPKRAYQGDNDTMFYPRPRKVLDVEESLNIWREQMNRIQRMNSVCDQLNRTRRLRHPPVFTTRFLVDDRNRVLFGYIPKVGCKTWKGVFSRIQREHGQLYHKLRQYDDQEREKRLREYRKVLFVRDPIVRLLSAYLSKFSNLRNLQKTWEQMYGLNILKTYRPGSEEFVREVAKLPKGDRPFLNVTLTEFIRFIVDKTDRYVLHEYSDHWLPQSIVSHVCEVRYDFIGKYENLAVEAPFVLNWLGLSSVAGFPEVHSSGASTVIADEYAKVPLLHIDALRKYYAEDFKIFGYESTDTISKITHDIFDIDMID